MIALCENKPKAQNEFSDIGFLHSDDDLSIQAFEYSNGHQTDRTLKISHREM